MSTPTAAPPDQEALDPRAYVAQLIDNGTWPPEDWQTMGAATRLALVQAHMPTLEADRTANISTDRANYSYSYVTEAQLLAVGRRMTGMIGLAVTFSEEDVTQNGNVTICDGVITFQCDVNGERDQITCKTTGYGSDPFDKGPNKAKTAAFRTGLLKNLMQGGGPGDVDPEQEAHERTSQGYASSGADTRPVTEGQVRKFYGMARGAGITDEKLFDIIEHAIDGRLTIIDSNVLRQLTRDEAQAAYQLIEAYTPEANREQADLMMVDAAAARAAARDPLSGQDAQQGPATAAQQAPTTPPPVAAPTTAAPSTPPERPLPEGQVSAPDWQAIEQLRVELQTISPVDNNGQPRNWSTLFEARAADWFGVAFLAELSPPQAQEFLGRMRGVRDRMTEAKATGA